MSVHGDGYLRNLVSTPHAKGDNVEERTKKFKYLILSSQAIWGFVN